MKSKGGTKTQPNFSTYIYNSIKAVKTLFIWQNIDKFYYKKYN